MVRTGRAAALPPPPDAFDTVAQAQLGDALGRRYAALLTKYRALVRKYREEGTERLAVYKLALWALRNRTSGLALVEGEHITVVNDRFRELEVVAPGGAWLAEPPDGGRRHGTLHALVLAQAKALARGTQGSAVQRFGWSSAEPERFIELYLDRPQNKRAPGTFVLVHDVTRAVREEREHQRLRARLQEQDQLHVLGRLASSIAHDFNNSFFAIRLQLEGLIHDAQDARQRARLQELLELLHGEAGRIRALQDVTRQRRELPAEVVDLVPVVREAARLAGPHLAQGSKQVRLSLALPRAAQVLGQAGELRDAVLNLLINAGDAIAARGRIDLALRVREGKVRLSVADTGGGIAREHLPRIFDPFFTTKAGRGTGQGLAALPGMMARLGGTVVARNRAPRGASFVLTFPRASPVEPAQPAARVAPRARRCTLLVVDDDPNVLRALQRALARHRVLAVGSGEEALAVARRERDLDVVLCDLGLPGIDGFTVARRLARLAPGLPVVILSGLGATLAPDKPRPGCVRAVLTKPVGRDALEAAIASALS